jgi:adenylate kinase family enzyme
MSRIHIIGSAGMGKTSLAQKAAQRLGVPHVELDDLHWRENWQQAELEDFRRDVRQALSGEAWVVDGNYSKVREIVWNRADTVVWLDYSLAVILWRLMIRTLRRAFTGEELWGGNRESLRMSFLSKDSILLWALTTYRRRRREYPQLFAQPEHAHLSIIRLRSPRQTRRWFDMLPKGEGNEAK